MRQRGSRKRRARRRQGSIRTKVDLLDFEEQFALPGLDDALSEENKAIRCSDCGRISRLVAGEVPYGWQTSPSLCPSCRGARRNAPDPDCSMCGGSGELPYYDMGDPAINMGWPIPCDCVLR